MAGFLDWLSSPEALGLAQGMLQASGPSRTPVGFGQVLAGGLGGYQEAEDRTLRRGFLNTQQKQLEESLRRAEDDRKRREAADMAFKRSYGPGAAFDAMAPNAPGAPGTSGVASPRPALPPGMNFELLSALDPEKRAALLLTAGQKDNTPFVLAPGGAAFDRTGRQIAAVPAAPKQSEFVRTMMEAGIEPSTPQGQQMLREYLQRKGQGQTINVDTKGETAGAQEAFKAVEKWSGDVQANAEEAARASGRIRLMSNALQKIPSTGMGTETKMAVANAAQSLFGWKIDPALPEKELFQQLSTQLQLNAAPKGQGQVSNYERDLFAKAVPNLGTSKEGVQKALAYYQKIADYDAKAADILESLRDPNTGVLRPSARAEVRKRLGPLFTEAEVEELNRASGGAPAAPAAATVPGAPPVRPPLDSFRR